MKAMRRESIISSVVVLVAVLGVMLLSSCGCDGNGTSPTPNTNTPTRVTFTPTQVAVITPASQAKAQSDKVWVAPGGSSTLSLLGSGWTALPAQSKMTTDSKGEGIIDTLNGCMLIYVFWDGELLTSGCQKSGGVTCAIAGTSVYNNSCAGQVQIDALTADMTLMGTWVAVTYNPGPQTTTVIVFSGSVRARPVLNTEKRTLGASVIVDKEHFWFTAPDNVLPALGGLRARQALPLSELPPLSGILNVTPWADRIRQQSLADGVALPSFTVSLPADRAVNLVTAGRPFEDGRVQEALTRGAPWAELSKSIFAGQNVAITIDQQGKSVDVRNTPYDQKAALELLAAAGYAKGFSINLLYVAEDDRLVQLAKGLAESLDRVSLKINLDVQKSDNDAAATMKEYAEKGLPAIWLRMASAAAPSGASILLLTGGSALADEAVQEAVLQVVPWERLANTAFSGKSLPINTEVGGKPVDVRTIPFNADAGQKALLAKYPKGFDLTLLYPPDDKQLASLAGAATDFLKKYGLRTTVDSVPNADAMERMLAIIRSGANVFWFGR